MASPYTFISYARADGEFVLRLATELRAKGISLWLDQLDIKVGHVWDRAVEEALEGCETFLIVLSPAAIASKNVMDELSFALEEDKRIVPLLHQDCKVPFRVRRFQRADFTANYDNGMRLLLEVLNVEEVPNPTKIEAGYIRIDTAGEVWIEGQLVVPQLAKKELLFLEYLCLDPGRVRTREEIIAVVYHEEFQRGEAVYDDTLNALVRRLRDRLEQTAKRSSCLVTIRGKGYRLDLK